jgi:mRNA interferase MazF
LTLIISNDIGNQYSPRVIVAPITTQRTDRVYPFEVLIPAGEGGRPQTSKVPLDQIRTLDKARLRRRLGRVSAERMNEVNQSVRPSLAL